MNPSTTSKDYSKSLRPNKTSIENIVYKQKQVSSYCIETRFKLCIENYRQSKVEHYPDAFLNVRFHGGRAHERNAISKRIYRDQMTVLAPICEKFKNKGGQCQSMLAVTLMIYASELNSMERAERYDNWEEGDIERLTFDIMEDIAVFALGGKNLSSHGDDGIALYYKRWRLFEILEGIAEAQIKKNWPAYDTGCRTGWYIYTCAMIMRTYGVNVFIGDGRDFALAFLTRGTDEAGELQYADRPRILHQAYNKQPSLPGGVAVLQILGKGHDQLILLTKEATFYLNCQNKGQFTLHEEGYSALYQTFCAICDVSNPLPKPSYDDIRYFASVYSKNEVFIATRDYTKLVHEYVPDSL